MELRLRPASVDDLDLFRRFSLEPGLMGPNWYGFRDPEVHRRRFETDNFLGPDDGRLMVHVDIDTDTNVAGFVAWRKEVVSVTPFWSIGISLLPEWRGRGIGWRAQAMLCDYLFQHSPVERIEAGTQTDNIAEQKALVKAGFTLEGTIRAVEFRAGAYRDGMLYSRLRSDPAPTLDL